MIKNFYCINTIHWILKYNWMEIKGLILEHSLLVSRCSKESWNIGICNKLAPFSPLHHFLRLLPSLLSPSTSQWVTESMSPWHFYLPFVFFIDSLFSCIFVCFSFSISSSVLFVANHFAVFQILMSSSNFLPQLHGSSASYVSLRSFDY